MHAELLWSEDLLASSAFLTVLVMVGNEFATVAYMSGNKPAETVYMYLQKGFICPDPFSCGLRIRNHRVDWQKYGFYNLQGGCIHPTLCGLGRVSHLQEILSTLSICQSVDTYGLRSIGLSRSSIVNPGSPFGIYSSRTVPLRAESPQCVHTPHTQS